MRAWAGLLGIVSLCACDHAPPVEAAAVAQDRQPALVEPALVVGAAPSEPGHEKTPPPPRDSCGEKDRESDGWDAAGAGAPSSSARRDPGDDAKAPEGCGPELVGQLTGGLYRALTRGAPDIRGRAALAILVEREHQARSVIRRAIAVVSRAPTCAQLRPLTDTLEDCRMDDTTRADAALALGAIARSFPCTFPRGHCSAANTPIPSWSKRALERCADHGRPMVARACVEALGFVPSTNIARLKAIRDDVGRDSLVRLFAGRALSRITKTPSVTIESLDKILSDAQTLGAQ